MIIKSNFHHINIYPKEILLRKLFFIQKGITLYEYYNVMRKIPYISALSVFAFLFISIVSCKKETKDIPVDKSVNYKLYNHYKRYSNMGTVTYGPEESLDSSVVIIFKTDNSIVYNDRIYLPSTASGFENYYIDAGCMIKFNDVKDSFYINYSQGIGYRIESLYFGCKE